MITIFNSKSVYIGKDMKKFSEIRDYLDANHIQYKYKVKNQMGQWTGRGTLRGNMGSAGNPSDQMCEYEILIHQKDADRVKLP